MRSRALTLVLVLLLWPPTGTAGVPDADTPVVSGVAWHRDDVHPIAPISLVGGVLVAHTEEGAVGLDVETGKTLWTTTDAPIWRYAARYGEPTTLGRQQVYPVFQTSLGVLDGDTGDARLVDVGSPVGFPTAVGDHVIVPCGDAVCAMDLDGTMRWTSEPLGPGRVHAVHEEAWHVSEGGVTALDADGNVAWRLRRAMAWTQDVAEASAGAWAVDENDTLLHVVDGEVVATLPLYRPTLLAVVGDDVLVSERHRVHRLGPDLEERWSSQAPWGPAALRVQDDLLVGIGSTGGISLFDLESGELTWYAGPGGLYFSSPDLVVHGDIVVRSGWTVQALRVDTQVTSPGTVIPTDVDDDALRLEAPYGDSLRVRLQERADGVERSLVFDAHPRVPSALPIGNASVEPGAHAWSVRQEDALVAGDVRLDGIDEQYVRDAWSQDAPVGNGTGRPLWWLPGIVVSGGPAGIVTLHDHAWAGVDPATGTREEETRPTPTNAFAGHPTDPGRYATEYHSRVTVHGPEGEHVLGIPTARCGDNPAAGACAPTHSPMSAGDRLYAGGYEAVVAIEWNGSRAWQVPVEGRVQRVLALADGVLAESTVYAPECTRATLTRFDAAGNEAWSRTGCQAGGPQGLAATDALALWTHDEETSALDLETGEERWTTLALAAVPYGDGFLALSAYSRRVQALDVNGTVLFEAPAPTFENVTREYGNTHTPTPVLAAQYPAWAVAQGRNVTVSGPNGTWNETLLGVVHGIELRGGLALVHTEAGTHALDAGALDGVRWASRSEPIVEERPSERAGAFGPAVWAVALAVWVARRSKKEG